MLLMLSITSTVADPVIKQTNIDGADRRRDNTRP